MALTIELWEDSGTEVTGRGTIQQEVDNIGWKSSSFDETFPPVDYPIRRPLDNDFVTASYQKFNYFKIYGSYDYAHELEIQFEGEIAGNGGGSGVAKNVHLLYNWTNVYTTPTNTLMAGSTYNPSLPPVWRPQLSTTGPNGTMSPIQVFAPDTTYYTMYLVTQLVVYPGEWDDYGNLNGDFKFKLQLKERKSGLPDYDPDLVNWSW